jgi:hypothetical protein
MKHNLTDIIDKSLLKYYPDEFDDFTCIKDELKYADNEKGISQHVAIIERDIDGKLFEISYNKYSDFIEYNNTVYEVMPVAKVIIKYERIK